MPQDDSQEVIQARVLPLAALQAELQRTEVDALAGDAETILRALPPGHGGVVRLRREATAEALSLRAALREAATHLRPETGHRGLLVTASREEGPLVALYFWYAGDAAAPGSEEVVAQQLLAVSVAPPLEQEQSLAEAAVTLRVSIKTVRRAIKAGRVPARLVPGPRGPEYRVDIRPLQDASREREAAPKPPPPQYTSADAYLQEALARISRRLEDMEEEMTRLRRP